MSTIGGDPQTPQPAKVSDSPVFPANLDQDAQDAYERAKERADLVCAEWERLGRPVLAEWSKGQTVPHPLLAEIRAADRLADHLRRRLARTHSGPAPGAVVRPLSIVREQRITRRGKRAS